MTSLTQWHRDVAEKVAREHPLDDSPSAQPESIAGSFASIDAAFDERIARHRAAVRKAMAARAHEEEAIRRGHREEVLSGLDSSPYVFREHGTAARNSREAV